MLLAYTLISGETIAGSANRSNLGVIPSGSAALFGFRALIFLDIDSSGIEQEEIVCTGEPSLLTALRVQLGFPEISIPTVAKKAFFRFAFSSSRTVSVFSSRLIGPICCLLLGFAALENTFQYAAVVFAEFIFSQKNLLFARLRSPVISFRLSCNSPRQFRLWCSARRT